MRKIGELKGKPIIEGNPNEIKKNQIHYKESDGGITLSERKEDNTLSSVTSGSGSGDAFQYFKIINTDSDFLISIGTISKIVEIITHYHGSYTNANRVDGYNSPDMSLIEYLENSIAVKVMCGDFAMGTIAGYSFIKGNTVKDKILYAAKINNAPEEEINFMLQGLDSTFKEITKEEYESMITYKPE